MSLWVIDALIVLRGCFAFMSFKKMFNSLQSGGFSRKWALSAGGWACTNANTQPYWSSAEISGLIFNEPMLRWALGWKKSECRTSVGRWKKRHEWSDAPVESLWSLLCRDRWRRCIQVVDSQQLLSVFFFLLLLNLLGSEAFMFVVREHPVEFKVFKKVWSRMRFWKKKHISVHCSISKHLQHRLLPEIRVKGTVEYI